MNAALPVEVLPATLPMRLSFTLWRLASKDDWDPCSPRQELNAESLAEAVNLATPHSVPVQLARGGWPAFVILETDERTREGKAKHRLRFYTVKSKRTWRSDGEFGTVRQVAVPYAVHSGTLAVNHFEPRRPFSAATDDPGNGRQPDEARMIELRR